MKRISLVPGILTAALALAGCAPTLILSNNTDINVRMMIVSEGAPAIISLGAGESMSIEVNEGSYGAGLFADEEWYKDADEYRRFLVESLTNPEEMTGEGIMRVVAELQKLSSRIAQMKSKTVIMCKGTVGSEEGALVEVNSGSNGELSVACH